MTTEKLSEGSKNFDFNAAFVPLQSQEEGSEFEVLNDNNQPTGFFIRLAGPDSTRRKRAKARLTDFFMKSGIGMPKSEPRNRKQRRAAAASGDQNSGETSMELEALQLEDMVAATISWRYPEGFVGPECNEANIRHLYTIHPTLYEQVQEKAEDIERFIKR